VGAPTNGLVSIVVPTYKEAANLPHLIPAISTSMRDANLNFEIVVVDDDSRDGSEECVKRLDSHPVRMIVRKNARGLSSAVVEGFRQSRGEFLVCMDADLSHPPERIPALIDALRQPPCDFVIGSRYAEGGSTADDWGWGRRLNSWVATLFARPLTRARDPMAGFFALRRETFEHSAPLSPIGYKIGLELLVKCGCRDIREVPIHFVDRKYGETKLTLREQINYLRHVKRLLDFKYGQWSRLLQFCLVGSSGVVVDLLTFNLCLRGLSLPLTVSRAVAVAAAMTSNFWFNRRLTFSYSRTSAWVRAYTRFVLSCSLGALVNWGVSVGLVTYAPVFHERATLAAVVGIGCGTIFNFLLSSRWAFDRPPVG
jgi:dolichol-phosphate mannosyltransferase